MNYFRDPKFENSKYYDEIEDHLNCVNKFKIKSFLIKTIFNDDFVKTFSDIPYEYTRFFYVNDLIYSIRQTIKDSTKELDPEKIKKFHENYVVSKKKLKAIISKSLKSFKKDYDDKKLYGFDCNDKLTEEELSHYLDRPDEEYEEYGGDEGEWINHE